MIYDPPFFINFLISLHKYTINTQHFEERNYPYFHEDMI